MSFNSPVGQHTGGSPSPLQTPAPRSGSPSLYFVPYQYGNFPAFQTPPPVSQPSPVDDVYRPHMRTSLFDTPGSTPGTDRSQVAPLTADPSFSTDEYEVEATPTVTASRSRKGKAPVPADSVSEAKPKRLRSTCTPGESALIVDCWADMMQDPEVATYYTETNFWARVTEKYQQHKTPAMKDHERERRYAGIGSAS